MTDAPIEYNDVSFPALDGSSNNINNNNINNNNINGLTSANNTSINNNNNNNTNNNNNNNNNVANSWSSQSQNNSPQANQQTKLNYLLLSSNQRAIQQLYQQQQNQQQQHQQNQQQSQQHQQPQQQQQSQQQVVNNHLIDSSDSHNTDTGAMVSQYNHLQPQQPQQQQQQQTISNNNMISTSTSNSNNNTSSTTSSTTNMQSQPSSQQKRPGLPNPIVSSERCITFKIAPEERRHRDFELEQSKILKEIMQKTNTKIEVTTTKDSALNFCIIGKDASLQAAKNLVLQDFQTSVTLTVAVPKSLHGRLLGPKGTRLASIQDETQTKIQIPRKEADSDIIKIVGLKNNAEMAVQSIRKYAREFADKTVEKVSVERIYLLFITGPFNENLKKWEEMGAKVSTSGGILPSNNDRESGHADEVTFTIMGEASAVNQVKEEIQQIYEDKKKKCTTVNIEVKKAQHKYILGTGGQNLRNLFAKTGVSVELPRESEVETITLRGERSKLGPALSELYTQAHSETDEFFEVESWLHKYLIGPRKTNFIDFKARNVDAKSMDDKIKLHGPPSEVDVILDVLEAELQNLRETIIRKDIRIEARIHGYIIGKAGATVDQIREESGAYVFVPKNDEPSEFITLEGTREAVAIAEEKINAIAKKYEASRKLVIDQQLHGSIIGRGGEKIRSIREKFTQVVFAFPEQGSKNNEITILGPTDEVEECYEYLNEFHKQLQESNHQVQVPIKKDIIKYLPDAQQAIKRIRTDHKVKVDLFINDNDAKSSNQTIRQANPTATAAAAASTANASVEQPASADSKKKSARGKANKKLSQNHLGEVVETSQVANDVGGDTKKKTNGNSNSNISESYAVVIGKKEDVDQAKAKVSKLFEELSTTTEFEVKVSHKLYQYLGPKTRLYRQLLDEFEQKVNLTFHTQDKQIQANSNTTNQHQVAGGGDVLVANTNSETDGAAANTAAGPVKKGKKKDTDENRIDIVKIRGPKNIAKKAEKKLETLVAECQEKVDKSFAAQVTVEAAVMDKFVYTDKIKLNKIRESQNIKLTIPDRRDIPQLQCTIVGYEKNVQAAMQQFKKLVKEVEERTEETIEIPSQVHPRLIGAQGRAVKKLMDDFKVNVKFARQGDPNPNSVTLYGSSSAITAAKNHMIKLADQYMASAGRANNNNNNNNNSNNNSNNNASITNASTASSNNNSQQQPQTSGMDAIGNAE